MNALNRTADETAGETVDEIAESPAPSAEPTAVPSAVPSAVPVAVPAGRTQVRSGRRPGVNATVGVVMVAGAAAAAGLPWLVNAYLVSMASYALILAVLTLSAQLLQRAGLASIGQAGYLGVGAYTAAALGTHAGVTNGVVHLAAATGTAAAAAAVVGVLAVRTRAAAYLMVTLACGELIHITAVQAVPLTGGSDGMHTPPVTLLPGRRVALLLDGYAYLYVLACVTAITALMWWLRRTRFTLIVDAVAAHEPRTAACGHNPTRYLWATHTIAGAVAGAGGALLVAAHGYVSPADLTFDVSALALVAAVVALRSLPGAVAAAVGVIAVRDLAGGVLDGWAPALLGAGFVIVAYLPRHRLPRQLAAWRHALTRRRTDRPTRGTGSTASQTGR